MGTHGRWENERCFILGTGPSLTQADVDAVRGQGRVIAVNRAYRFAPWADVLFSIDHRFWEGDAPEFDGEKWTVWGCRAIESHGLRWLPSAPCDGFGRKILHRIAGSGGTAINLALLFGCAPIILLGFDNGMTDGHRHCTDDYDWGNPDAQRFATWKKQLAKAAPTVAGRVINCSRETSLECFGRAALEVVL